VRPDLTINAGLRWQIQFPWSTDGQSYARLQDWAMVYGLTGEGNLFKPGTMTGTEPQLVQYKKGDRAYNMDWNNLAPSIGAAWRPKLKSIGAQQDP
jgi:hypothetical protein